MSTPRRILFLCYELPPVGGGGGRALWHLCHHLSDLGFAVDVLTSCGEQGEPAIPGKAEIHTVSTRRLSVHQAGPRAMLEYLWRARPVAERLIAEHRYQLLHYFFSVPTGLLSYAVGREIPYVVSLRGGDVPGYNPGELQLAHAVLKPLNRRVWRRAAAITSVSDHLAAAVNRIEPGVDITVIPNGVDTELFRPSPGGPSAGPPGEPDAADPVHLLCVARLIECKGLQYLLECMARLPAKWPCRLTVIGTGSYRQTLIRKARALGLSRRVDFAGVVAHEELPRWYQQASAFVLPSYGDACPQTAIEAMACGLPVVATRDSGVSHYVEHGVSGFLVAARSAEALEAPLRELIGDPELRRRMGSASAAKVRAEFTWRSMAERFVDLYREHAGR